MRALVTVAGTPIPDPSEYNATTSTIVDSARNVEGKMVGAVVRNEVKKIELVWRYISAEDWAKILGIFRNSFINDITFYNQDSNDWESMEGYISDRTAGVFLRRDDGSIKGYTQARLAIIEV